MKMREITPGEIATKDFHQFMLGCIAPRPIAWVSTMDAQGRPNLAPYSFFNAFSSNPPIVVFSSNRRVADNTTKDTLSNIEATGEAVINMVSYSTVRQMAVTSIQFDTGVDEFAKAGVHALPSTLVKPYRVQESPAHLECKVQDIITLGDSGGAGHLILCHVVKMHIREDVIVNNRIDPHKIDLMGRMGRAYYTRASGDSIHTIVQSVVDVSIGFDALPPDVQQSSVLTGNDLGRLAGVLKPPSSEAIEAMKAEHPEVLADERQRHQIAQQLISEDKVDEALALLWYS